MNKPFGMLILISLLAFVGPACAKSPHGEKTVPNPCGLSPSDWCPAPAGDPCGRHKDAASCRADPACEAMPYRGESVVACHVGERGFSDNCPTVGCQSPSKK